MTEGLIGFSGLYSFFNSIVCRAGVMAEDTGLKYVVLFKIGDDTYSIEMSSVRTIERIDNFKPNDSGEGPKGWVDYESTDIPVYALSERFADNGVSYQQGERVLIMSYEGSYWGLMVDKVIDMLQVRTSETMPMPTIAQDPALNVYTGVFILNNEIILSLNPDRLHPDAQPIEIETLPPKNPEENPEENPAENPQENPEENPAENPQENPEENPEEEVIKNSDASKPVPGEESPPSDYIGRMLMFTTFEQASSEQKLVFGLSITQVVQVIESVSIRPVPASKPHVLGLTNWRRVPVPVVDLNSLFGYEPLTEENRKRFLIIRSSGNKGFLCLATCSDVRVVDLPIHNEPFDGDTGFDSSFIRGVFKLDKDFLVIPDIEKIIKTP